MKWTIVGAGAIGGVVGAHLIRAGHEVTFVDLVEEHVRQINADGLRIEGLRGEFVVPARAITPDQLAGPLGSVVLAVKAMNTESASRMIAPHLADDGYIVSLQNGLNEEIISQVVGKQRTVGAHINWAADYLGPGQIIHGGEGSFYVGELDGQITPRVQAIGEAFRAFTEVVVTDNIWGYIWSKHALAAVNYFASMSNHDVVDILAGEQNRRTAIALADEAVSVPERLGVRLQPFDGFQPALMHPKTAAEWQAAIDSFDTLLDNLWRYLKRRTGIWRDLAVRQRKTEVDVRVGDIVNRGRQIGLEMPLMGHLLSMFHELEAGQRPLDWSNYDELGALARQLGRTGQPA